MSFLTPAGAAAGASVCCCSAESGRWYRVDCNVDIICAGVDGAVAGVDGFDSGVTVTGITFCRYRPSS